MSLEDEINEASSKLYDLRQRKIRIKSDELAMKIGHDCIYRSRYIYSKMPESEKELIEKTRKEFEEKHQFEYCTPRTC